MPASLQSQSKPLQFVILDNKNILRVVPQPVVENSKNATPLPKISPKLLLPLPQGQHQHPAPQKTHKAVKVLPSESPSPIKVLPSKPTSPVSLPEATKQIPIQMLFYNGNLVQVLPGKHQKLEPISNTGSLPSNLQQTKSGSLPSNLQFKKSGTEVFLSKKDFDASLVPTPSGKKVKEDGKKSSESM